jgi:hypothetical protein
MDILTIAFLAGVGVIAGIIAAIVGGAGADRNRRATASCGRIQSRIGHAGDDAGCAVGSLAVAAV